LALAARDKNQWNKQNRCAKPLMDIGCHEQGSI